MAHSLSAAAAAAAACAPAATPRRSTSTSGSRLPVLLLPAIIFLTLTSGAGAGAAATPTPPIRYYDGRLSEQQMAFQFQREKIHYLTEEVLRLQEVLAKYKRNYDGSTPPMGCEQLLEHARSLAQQLFLLRAQAVAVPPAGANAALPPSATDSCGHDGSGAAGSNQHAALSPKLVAAASIVVSSSFGCAILSLGQQFAVLAPDSDLFAVPSLRLALSIFYQMLLDIFSCHASQVCGRPFHSLG